jgi:hypothetical protein
MRTLDQLMQLIDQIDFGTIDATFHRHQGKTSAVEVRSKNANKFQANQEAIAFILQMIGKRVDDNFTGSDTIQLTYHQGKLQKIFQHIDARLENS